MRLTINDTDVGIAIKGAFTGGVTTTLSEDGPYVMSRPVTGFATAPVALVSDLSQRAGWPAFTLDHRSPEHPVPTAVDDTAAANRGLVEVGYEAGNIPFAGKSSSGGLAVPALLARKDEAVPLAACALRMPPYADLTVSGGSMATREEADRIPRPKGLPLPVPDFSGDLDPSHPQISILGELTGPQVLIQVGSHEILIGDAVRLAARAATADVPVTLEVTAGVPHVFQGFAAALDHGDVALTRAAPFAREHPAAA